MKDIRLFLIISFFLFAIHELVCAQEKSLIDYFLPMEPQAPLISNDIWGDGAVLPRDTANGIEDPQLKQWVYWDGMIVKDDEGTYHMYGSCWDQSLHHGIGWTEASKAMHATSNNPMGPFRNQKLAWPHWNESKAHNTIGLRMHDGRYAMISSEITPGIVFTSDSPYGPWEFMGEIKIDYNGYGPGAAHYNYAPFHMANVMVILRPDGRYQIMPRQCSALISEDGILGPYKIMGEASWKNVEGVPQKYMEDPTIWYSDSMYHCAVNYYEHSDSTYHLTSVDGVNNWKNRGIAYQHNKGAFRYTDGTINEWYTVQRPTVYTENGIVTHFNFSVIDVHKGQDGGNDNHGSKIIVVPFDGENFGKDLRDTIRKENAIIDATPPPVNWQSTDIGSGLLTGNSGYEAVDSIYRIKASGSAIDGSTDEFRFVYQHMTNDATILSQIIVLDPYQTNAKAGVMIRKSLDADAENVFLSLTKDEGSSIQYRASKGGETIKKQGPKIYTQYWLRLSKEGNKVIGYISTNPYNNWTVVDTIPLEFGSDFYVGFACNSADNSKLAVTTFRKPDAFLHSNERDYILKHNLPSILPLSGEIQVEVEYVTSEERDIVIGLRDITDWYGAGDVKTTVNGYGITTINYSPNIVLDPSHRYQLEINMRPKGGDWKTSLFNTQIVWTSFILDTVYAESIELSEYNLEIKSNRTHTLQASIIPNTATVQGVFWKSDNPEVAQVDYVLGKVLALSKGTAKITAHSEHNPNIKATCTVKVDGGSVTIRQTSKNEDTLIFPNPFKEELNIDLAENSVAKILLRDLSGKIIYVKKTKGEEMHTIKLSYKKAPKGMYLLEIHESNQTKTYKILRN